MRRTKTFWRLAAIAGIAVIAAWAVCFARVNAAYPQAGSVRAGRNEPLQYGPYLITVQEVSIRDTLRLYTENGLSAEGKSLPEATLLCTVVIRRNERDAAEPTQANLKLPCLAAVSGAWSNRVGIGEVYTALNPEAAAPDALRQGEERTFLLPFELWKDSFSDAGWEHLNERTFVLQLALYPDRYEILL